MKKIFALGALVTLCLGAFNISSVWGSSDISVKYNGDYIEFDQEPIIINGRTMVPLRAIFEALGAQVEWDPEAKQITSFKDDTAVLMTVASNTMTMGEIGGNGVEVTLDAPPTIVNGRTLVPARAIAEAFSCNVSWDSNTKTVEITEGVAPVRDTTIEETTVTTLPTTVEATTVATTAAVPDTPSYSRSNRIYFNPAHKEDTYVSGVFDGDTLYFNYGSIYVKDLYVYDGNDVTAFSAGDLPRCIVARDEHAYYYGHSDGKVYHLDTTTGNREVLYDLNSIKDSFRDIRFFLYRSYLLILDPQSGVYMVNLDDNSSSELYVDNGCKGALVSGAEGKIYMLISSGGSVDLIEADPNTGSSRVVSEGVGGKLFCAVDGSGVYFPKGSEYYFYDSSTGQSTTVTKSEFNRAEIEYKEVNDVAWNEDWNYGSNSKNGVHRIDRSDDSRDILYSGSGCIFIANNDSNIAFIQSSNNYSGLRPEEWGNSRVIVMDINGNNRQEIFSYGGGNSSSGSTSSSSSSDSQQICPTCGGNGMMTCTLCMGTGKGPSMTMLGMSVPQDCPPCGGTGRVPCSQCGGSGRIPQ